MKIAFIGGGNMASAMILGLLDGNNTIAVVEPFEGARQALLQSIEKASSTKRESGGIALHESAQAAAKAGSLDAEVIILAVKPQVMVEVAKGLAPYMKEQLVISIAAGIRLKDLSRWLGGHAKLIRAMPNTPALIGMGIAGMTPYTGTSQTDCAMAEALLKTVGDVVWIDDEEKIDAVTALSGSGPAYVYLVMEALQAAGEKLGLSAAQAGLLALQTMRGATELARRSEDSPAILREKVTSKGGTTAAALAVMDRRGLKDIFDEALQAARTRGAQMGEEFGSQA